MKQYINKDDIAAKIENRIKETESMRSMVDPFWEGQISAFDSVLKILDTLETKEVDLEEELKNCLEKESTFINDNREVRYYNGDSFNHIYEIEFIAKHFFELGLKAKKGE